MESDKSEWVLKNALFLSLSLPVSLEVFYKYHRCTLTFSVHSTGAEEVDSFIAQAKKLVALLDISKISKNNHK